jgi:3-oxoacyl-[acyl-carrier-protein] synthase II
MKKRRVVITGIGVVAPNGIGKDEFWQATINGKSGVDLIMDFDTSGFDSKIAAKVIDFNPLDFMKKNDARKTDRFVHFGIASTRMAIEDAKLNLEKENKDEIGVYIGSGLGGMPFHEEQILAGFKKGFHKVSPLSVPKITPNSVSSHIAIEFNLTGSNMVISNACASGTFALTEAYKKIASGATDIMIAGGAEAPLTEFTFGAYNSLNVLSKRNDKPDKASRPFDKERDGFVLGEGAAVLILEELGHAIKRNGKIYAEILGFSANSGAYHMVMPKPSGNDVVDVMSRALQDSDIDLQEIDYINAHGTSTQANDKVETQAIKKVFKDYAYKIPVSSIKSAIGHTIGAAGAIEAAVCALAIEHNIIPPTCNYNNPDPECDLDYVPNKARKARVNIVLSNSFGFGGCNVSIILSRYKDKGELRN